EVLECEGGAIMLWTRRVAGSSGEAGFAPWQLEIVAPRALVLLLHPLDLPQHDRSVVAPGFNCFEGGGVASLPDVRAAQPLGLLGRPVQGGPVDGERGVEANELVPLIPARQWKDYHSIEPSRPVENVLLEASRIVGRRDPQYPPTHAEHAVEGVEQV